MAITMPTGPVFISHASRDAALAHELVAALEASFVACWVSGRDIAPGANYQEAIVGAITDARALVLLLTEAANASDEVKKELSLASAQGVAVYPVRLGGVQPNSALRYELATRQWIDGSDPAAIATRLTAIFGAAPGSVAAVPALPLPDKPSLAVLPFENISGDPEQDYFADGVVEDITTALSRYRWLFVIARNSSFTYKGRAVDVKQVGRELGVRYVLEGSIRRAGNRVRITGQLIEAATGGHVWADRFEGDLADIFELQDRITDSVVGGLEPTLQTAEIERARRKRPESLDAYDLYLHALALNGTYTRESCAAMLDLALRAVALDPSFARAHAVALLGYLHQYIQGWTEDVPPARAAALDIAERGLRADRSDSLMLAVAGQAFAWMGMDLAKGVAFTEDAVAANPNDIAALLLAAVLQVRAGKPERSLELVERAFRLSPRDSLAWALYEVQARAQLLEGDMDSAYRNAQRALQLNANYLSANKTMASIAALLGKTDEARAAVARILAIEPDYSMTWERERYPVLQPERLAIMLEGLRRAGVPE